MNTGPHWENSCGGLYNKIKYICIDIPNGLLQTYLLI